MKKKRICMYLDPRWYKKLQKAAAKEDRSASYKLNELLCLTYGTCGDLEKEKYYEKITKNNSRNTGGINEKK